MKYKRCYLLVALILIFPFCFGCSNPKKEAKENLESQISEVYELSTVEEDDFALYELQEDGSYSEITYNSPAQDLTDLIFSKMTYEIIETDDTSCTITVTAPNYRLLFCDVFGIDANTLEMSSDEATEDDYIALMIEKIEAGEFEYVENTVTVPLVDGEPQITNELIDAFYGNMYTFTEELMLSIPEE